MATAATVVSPCVGICQLRPGTDLCEGCLRTLNEITEWSAATSVRRLEILGKVAARRLGEAGAAAAPSRARGGVK